MLRTRTALATIAALSLALAACGGSEDEAVSDDVAATPAPSQAAAAPQPTPTPAVAASAETTDSDTSQLVAHLREKSMRLWEVYNTYDLQGLKVFYEPSYWQEREEQTRLEMQPFQSRGATLTAEETSPPTEIAPGTWETRHKASFPGGSVNLVFIYEQFDGEWLLTHLEPG